MFVIQNGDFAAQSPYLLDFTTFLLVFLSFQ